MSISNLQYLFMIEMSRTRNLNSVIVAALLLTALSGLAFSSNLHAENATGSQTITGGALSMDYVDGSNTSVSSPTLTFSNATYSYTCTPTASGPSASINTGTRRLQIDNPTGNASVSVSMGQTNGADTWAATVAGSTYRMDGNDNGSSGSGTDNLDGASSLSGSYYANWIDNNTSTIAGSGTGSSYIFDMGSAKPTATVRIHGFSGSPYNVQVWGSNNVDGVTGAVQLAQFTVGNSGWQDLPSSSTAAFRYARVTLGGSGSTAFSELEMLPPAVAVNGCQTDGPDTDAVTGNMLADPTGITGTAVSGCPNTATYTPNASSTTLAEGTTTSASLVTVGNAQSCKINISGGTLRQSIPGGQTPGTYTIGLTFTAV